MNELQLKGLAKFLISSACSKCNPKSQNSLYSFYYPEPLMRFFNRLNTFIRCSSCCYPVALLYLDRLLRSNNDITLDMSTVHLLFSTSLLIANQFIDDNSERLGQFASLLNMSSTSMSILQTDFLFRIRFDLVFSEAQYEIYVQKLNWCREEATIQIQPFINVPQSNSDNNEQSQLVFVEVI
eukprot:c11144_g1_i1.p1 GENE.c11144_g1_i1~~c11144_g1_i1.p1  ORF type:complete len:182 (+),score=19.11 c11144_g1_i1:56-601(+)